MNPNLSRRLAVALSKSQLPVEQRLGYAFACDYAEVFSDLPPEVQLFIHRAEMYTAKTYNPSQERDEHGRWTDGGSLSAWNPGDPQTQAGPNKGSVKSKTWYNWEHGPDGNSYLEYMRQQACRLVGLPVPPSSYDPGRENNFFLNHGWGAPNETDIRSLVTAIAKTDNAPELYRGVAGLTEEEASRFAALKPGDTLDLPLTSFTLSPGVAEWYAADRNANSDAPILMKIQEGANAVTVPADEARYPQDAEAIVNGKFEVVASNTVSIPYYSRDSARIEPAYEGDGVVVYGPKSDVPESTYKEIYSRMTRDSGADLSDLNTEKYAFTNDRTQYSGDSPSVSVWTKQDSQTFRLIELKQNEAYKAVGKNG